MTGHRQPATDRRTAAAGEVHSASRSLTAALVVAFALLAALIVAPQALAEPDETVLVSRATGPDGASGNDGAGSSSVSADGRFVAFSSDATNLHPDDTDKKSDVFVRDLEENTTTLVSRATGAGGATGNDDSDFASISADGRYVAFGSWATNLHPDDSNDFMDVFVRDLKENTTTLVSRATGADGLAGNDHSSLASISADGRFVAFGSSATNLHPDDTDNKLDVFVRDLVENTTTLVSRATGAGGATGNDDSGSFSISADGRYVAFASCASNFHPGAIISCGDRDFGFGRLYQIFVRDLEENTTTLVSRATGADGVAGNDHSSAASISADGRLIAIESCATNLVRDVLEGCTGDPILGEQIFVRDLGENTTTLVSRAAGASSHSPSISADGRFIAYHSFPAIFVRDLEENTTTLASRASGRCGATMGSSWDSSVSADGRFVTFSSPYPEAPGTSLHSWQVYRRELSFRRESPKRPAELEIDRARVRAGRLVVEGSLDPAAAGARVAVTFRAAGKRLRLRPAVRADGQFRASGRLRGAQRRGGAGRLVVRYAGSETLRATTERLRAARRAVRLRIVRATRNGALGYGLALVGRVLRQARGRVRIEIEFTRPDCSAAAIADRVKVNRRGRFRLRRDLPPAARGMDLRVSVTHPGRGRLYGQRLGQACPSRPGELGADAVRCASVSQADGR